MHSPDLATELLHDPALMFRFFSSIPTVEELPETSAEGTLLRMKDSNVYLWLNDQWYCFKP